MFHGGTFEGCSAPAWITTTLRLNLKSDFDAAVDHTSLSVRVNLSEARHLVRRENHLAKPSLTNVGDVFEIDKKAVLPERLLAEDSQDPERFCSDAVT